MPSDPTLPEGPEGPEEPEENETVGLKLVDAESESVPSPDARVSTAGTDSTDRRRLPAWLFVAALIVFSIVIGWQAQVAGELEAEVAGLEAQLERTNALLDAHRSHLSEVRGGVHELSQSLQGLRALVDSDPEDPEAVLPEGAVPAP
jgi:hypothetical protein